MNGEFRLVIIHQPGYCEKEKSAKMFQKAFKTKNNTQVKSTERKKLRSRVESAFRVSESNLNKLLPNKCTINQLKLITHAGETVTVYTCDRRPMFFEMDSSEAQANALMPTVYSMWILPDLVPSFTTHAAVLPRLASGADLMLPGVIRQGTGYAAYGSCARNAVVAVNLTSNRSAIGIGTLAKSSTDLSMSNNAGVCVYMKHVFGDKLWSLEPSVTLEIPSAEAVMKAPQLVSSDEFPSLGDSMKPKPSAPATVKPMNSQSGNAAAESNENVTASESQATSNDDADAPAEESDATSPDERLRQAFLISIKKMGKKPPTPLLTSNFYRCHVLEADRDIDIKKTTYKKLSKFLQEMAANDYLTIREEPKGVEKIVSINVNHPDVKDTILRVNDNAVGPAQAATDGLFVKEMKELYMVTDQTAQFFNKFDVKCGEGIESAQVKKYLKDYVCNNKLQDPLNIRTIRTDDMLRKMCELDEAKLSIQFDDLLSLTTSQMEHNYAMRNRNELKTSGKQNVIKMTLATRAGNKQVTLIDHLEMFGIRLPEFAQACKVGVAASTSIIRPDCPGNHNKGQLMVQGNQIRFVHKLLTDTYKIPPKFITGFDLAKKEKKAKKK